MRKSIIAGIAGLLLAGGLNVAMAPGASAASSTYTCTRTTTVDYGYGPFTYIETNPTVTGPGKTQFLKEGYSCVKNP
jgi:ABC-type nitrate/sulfonate/bicarbonate transport system substrate-binding protein